LTIPKSIESYLTDTEIQFELITLPRPMDIGETAEFLADEASNLIRSVAIEASGGIVVTALPYPMLLDVRQLSEHIGTESNILTEERSERYFTGCDRGSFPPIPEQFNFRLIIDPEILDLEQVILQSGNSKTMIKLDKINANLLYQEIETHNFAVSSERLFAGRNASNGEQIESGFTPMRLKKRVEDVFDLPAMPEIAQDIMKLRVDPGADATRLAQIVTRDPSLAAQVISWASSPYYGYQGKIDSVETAIARVLGFELVMNLALGISIGKSLKVPMDGPLGVREFWRQAIYSASLAEKLCRAMPVKQRPERGLIYLSGLLHNFGHLLLGHVFPPQFKLVNASIEANPHIAVEDIEFYVLGVTHQELGTWLMQNWHMPEELIVAVQRHHQEEFWSKHAVYSNIVLVTNRILKRLNIGDSIETCIPESTLELLSLTSEAVESAMHDIQSESETLDILSRQLVA